MSNKNKVIVTLGADMKNRFLIVKNKSFCFGPDLGDLSKVENYEIFKRELKKAVGSIEIKTLAYDLHPGYFSSHYIKEDSKLSSSAIKQPVQHHHAHIASVIFEHQLKKPVIGISFDGTGYGLDQNIWGGEFLLVDRSGFKRLAHFKYIKMPGGDKVVTESWRMVLSILKEKGLPFLKKIKGKDKEIVLLMLDRGINSPLTSSVGRLFDAAAALLGICTVASYEAEGPIKLEKLCLPNIEDSYDFKVIKNNDCYIIDAEEIFLGMIKDLKKKKTLSYIATKFHNSIVEIMIKILKILSKENKIKDVALSGGVFQNNFLRNKTISRLESLDYNLYKNEKFPANDYNISIGQYYVSCRTCKN